MIPRSRPRKIEHPREIVSPALGYGQPDPFALGLCPYVGGHRQRLVVELESSLPPHLGLKGGCNVRPDLGSWLGITGQLPDPDPARYP